MLNPPQSTPQAREGTLIVSLSGEDAVSLIDATGRLPVARIAVAKNPPEITLSRDRTRAYVATPGGAPGVEPRADVLTVVDLTARKAIGDLKLGTCARAHDVRVSSDTARVWVACAPSQIIAELDLATGKIRAWPLSSDGAWFVAATPDDRKLYVPHLEGKRVTVVDRTSGKVSVAIDAGAQSGIDMSPDGRAAWIVDHERGEINILDTSSDKIAGRVPLTSRTFGRLRFTPDGKRVLLVQDRTITIIDPVTRAAIGTINLPFDGKVVDVAPDGSRAAVTHPENDRVSIVDLDTRTVIVTIPTGKTPDGIAWIR